MDCLYWAYWIAWFVATPFFIGRISEGRTIRGTIFGAYFFGLAGTYTSFIVFGNYGLSLQTSGVLDVSNKLLSGVDPSHVIIEIVSSLPFSNIILIVLGITMIGFYSTTFDAITYVVSEYSLRTTSNVIDSRIKIFWALVFIILPIALIFSESTLAMLQTLSIVAAFPLALIMALVIYSFLKDMVRHHDI